MSIFRRILKEKNGGGKLQLLFAIAFILTLSSCSRKPDVLPPGILPRDKMTDVLVDIHLAESGPQSSGITSMQLSQIMAGKYDEVMKTHHIRYTQFRTSFEYYLEHPTDLDEIYQEVVNRLTAMDGKTRSNRGMEKKPVDSTAINKPN